MMVKISTTIDCDGMPISKIFEAIRKLSRRWHPHVSNEDRNDGNTSLERGLDLDPDRIGLVIDPDALSLGPPKPLRSQDHQQNVGRAKGFGNLHAEIDARANIIDVPEYRFLSEMLAQSVKDAPGNILRIRTAIGDGYLRHHPFNISQLPLRALVTREAGSRFSELAGSCYFRLAGSGVPVNSAAHEQVTFGLHAAHLASLNTDDKSCLCALKFALFRCFMFEYNSLM
jgi:hypothetical protein